MNNHTPGPWVARLDLPWLVEDSNGGILASLIAPRTGDMHANAKLIAAAPELLLALRELLSSHLAMMHSREAGAEAQNEWSDRRSLARIKAAALIYHLGCNENE